jgi:hypothetical protein
MDTLENPEGALEEAVEAELESFLSQNDQKHVNHMMVRGFRCHASAAAVAGARA